jgi:GNAT superfamily N-acetyltransferase
MADTEPVLDRRGRVLSVRDLTTRDLAQVAELFDHLSPRSARQRFLSTSRRAGLQYVDVLRDPSRTLDAVVAVRGTRVLGVASTHQGLDASVEFAVAVEDADQGHGIGTLLVEALVRRSRARGLTTLCGTVLGGNTQMLDVLAHLGLPCHTVTEDGTVAVTVTVPDDPTGDSAHAAREDEARAAAVRPFVRPTSIAVLPAGGRHPGPLGWRPEVAVSTIARVAGGHDVPAGVDLAVLPDWVDDVGPAALACARAGVAAIALVGRRGRRVATGAGPPALTAELVDGLRDAGSRVLGPGSTCLLNTDPLVRLSVGPRWARTAAGVVGVVTDDSSRLGALLGELASRGLGTSVAVDLGASTDLAVGDVVAWLARDPRTELVVVCLHDPPPRALRAHLRGVDDALKPVVVWLPGRVPDTGPHEPGTPVLATSVTDVGDLASVFVQRGERPGRRAVVVTNGPDEAADATLQGLSGGMLLGPDLTQHSEMRIHFLAPGSAARGPVLALPDTATPEQVHDVLATLADDPGVDSVVLDLVPGPSLRRKHLGQVLSGLPTESSRGRRAPLIVAVDPHRSIHRPEVPAFDSVASALDVLARTSHHQSA